MLYDDIPSPKRGAGSGTQAQTSAPVTAVVAPPQVLRVPPAALPPALLPVLATRRAPLPSDNPVVSEMTEPVCQSKDASPEVRDDTQEHAALLQALAVRLPNGSQTYDPLRPNEYAALKSLITLAHASVTATFKRRRTRLLPGGDSVDQPGYSDGYSSSSDTATTARPSFASAASVTGCAHMNPAVSAIMKKMGYVDGKGLGAGMQGRVDPVVAMGNDGRGGLGVGPTVAVDAQDVMDIDDAPLKGVRPNKRATRSEPARVFSRVIFIQNLPRISAESISSELMDSCTELGHVEDLVVSSSASDSSASDALQAFVAFQDAAHAASALLALDGSEYHDVELRVSMYSETRFIAMSNNISDAWVAASAERTANYADDS